VQQLTSFQQTESVARSLCDSWDSRLRYTIRQCKQTIHRESVAAQLPTVQLYKAEVMLHWF